MTTELLDRMPQLNYNNHSCDEVEELITWANEAADAIERLENELLAASIRMNNDKLEIASLADMNSLLSNANNSLHQEIRVERCLSFRQMAADLTVERDKLKLEIEGWKADQKENLKNQCDLVADRDEWKARCEFSFRKRDALRAELDKLKQQEPAAWINGFGGGPANKGIYGWSDHPIGTKFYLAAGASKP